MAQPTHHHQNDKLPVKVTNDNECNSDSEDEFLSELTDKIDFDTCTHMRKDQFGNNV